MLCEHMYMMNSCMLHMGRQYSQHHAWPLQLVLLKTTFHAGKTLVTLDCLSKNAAWALALSQAADSGLWSAKPEDHATLKQHLAQDRAQLHGQIQRIESYFQPKVSTRVVPLSTLAQCSLPVRAVSMIDYTKELRALLK